MVVPEQYTYIAERALTDMSSGGVLSDVSAIGMKRLSRRIAETSGGQSSPKILSSQAKRLIMRYSIDQTAPNLTAFSPVASRSGFAQNALEFLEELSKNAIDDESLLLTEQRAASPLLKRKLRDIALLKKAFSENAGEDYFTEESYLALCAEYAAQSPLVSGSLFYFDNFHVFDAADYPFITALIKYSKECVFTLTHDKGEFFETTNRTLQELTECAENAGKKAEIINLGGKKPVGGAAGINFAERLLSREAGAQSPPLEAFGEEVICAEAENIRQEARFAAGNIREMIISGGYRLSDIAVVVGDMSVYSQAIRDAFDEFEIPFFLDIRRKIAYMPPARAFLFLLNSVQSASGISSSDIIAFSKTGFLPLDESESADMDNFVRSRGLRGQQLLRPLEAYEGDDEQKIEYLEDIRRRICEPIEAIGKAASKAASVGEYCRGIYSFMEEYEFEERIRQSCEALREAGDIESANICAGIYNEIITILGSLHDFFGQMPLESQRVNSMIAYALSCADVGVIPTASDRVFVGDTLRSRFSDIKVMFVLGANEGMLPNNNISAAILTDREKQEAAEAGMPIISTAAYRRKKENFLIYTLLSKPTKRLFVTRSDGEATLGEYTPSPLYETLSGVFGEREATLPEVTEYSSVQSAFAALGVYRRLPPEVNSDESEIFGVLEGIFEQERDLARYRALLEEGSAFDNSAVIEDAESWKKLNGTPAVSSVSRLETYSRCPFAHFAQYGLKLKKREEYKVESIDAGNILHGVAESYSKGLLKGEYTLADDTDPIARRFCLEEIAKYRFSIYGKLTSSSYLTNKLIAISQRAIKEISRQMSCSDFYLKSAETRFGRGGQYAPIMVDTPGGALILEGKIDRVDCWESGGESYIKIIDYKSSATALDRRKMALGLSLQLPAYLKALTVEKKVPAGMFYMCLNPAYTSIGNEKGIEEAENAVRSGFKLSGIALSDIKLIKALDRGSNGESFIKQLKITPEGATGKAAVSMEEIEEILAENAENIKSLSEKMLSGDISISPYMDPGTRVCDWCDYIGVCKFSEDFKGNKARGEKEMREESDEQ